MSLNWFLSWAMRKRRYQHGVRWCRRSVLIVALVALIYRRSATTALWTTKVRTTLQIAWCTRRSTTPRISTIRLWLKNGKRRAPTIRRFGQAALSGVPCSRYLVEVRLFVCLIFGESNAKQQRRPFLHFALTILECSRSVAA